MYPSHDHRHTERRGEFPTAFVNGTFEPIMSRPVIPKDPSEQLTLLSRMLRQVDVDARYKTRRRKALKGLITRLMTEFQKEVNGHDEARGG